MSHLSISNRLCRRLAWGIGLAMCTILASADPQLSGAQSSTLEATIFRYDGHDFVRAQTTLRTAEGKSAVNTKLDRETPAYKALMQKRSYSGDVTVFGKKYEANYAPLTAEDGRITGALFVAIPQ